VLDSCSADGITQTRLPLQAREEQVREEISVEEFKKGDRVQVRVDAMCLFLTRNGACFLVFFLHVVTLRDTGTVISIHPTNNLDFTAPIAARLRQRDTVLRTSADPSLLLQSLLDLSQFTVTSCQWPYGTDASMP